MIIDFSPLTKILSKIADAINKLSVSFDTAKNITRVYLVASQSIVQNIWTKVLVDTVVIDTQNFFNLSTRRYEARVSGYYHISAQCYLQSFSGTMVVGIFRNGSLASSAKALYSASTGGCAVSDILYLNAGDYVELYVQHNASSSILLSNGINNNFLAIHKL